MNEKSKKEIMDNLLFNNTLCVLATASKKGKPEAATIEYTVDEDYNIYFFTSQKFRKFKNLTINPKASIVISNTKHTLQIDGKTSKLMKPESLNFIAKYLSKRNHKIEFYNRHEWVLFKFKPTDIRVSSYPKWEAIID